MNNSLFPRNLPKKKKSYDINGGDGIFETEFLFYSEVFPRFVIKNFVQISLVAVLPRQA